jgi:hypothetical protein
LLLELNVKNKEIMQKLNEVNVQEMLSQFGLDFRVKKINFKAIEEILDGDGNIESFVEHESPYYGLYNTSTGKCINSVKGGYGVSQNDEILESVIRGAENFGELSLEKGYCINGGKKVAFQLRVDGLSQVANDELVRYITITDSNDGTSGLSVGIGDMTMSCKNQFFHFNKNAEFKTRHTLTIKERIAALPVMIQNALADSLAFIEKYQQMSEIEIPYEFAHDLVDNILGVSKNLSEDFLNDKEEVSTRKLNQMSALYENIDHQIQDKGLNLWGLHSGVTRWTTHEKSAPKRDNGRIESIMTGTNYRTNHQSLDFVEKKILELA